jgi:Ser/Thr protein kinase RdoA (MazF antagonist)
VAVTGYDCAVYDLRAIDLGRALEAFAGMAESPGGVGLDLERSAALMTAYREVATLPAHELAALPLVLRAEHLTGVLTGTARFLRRHQVGSQPDQAARQLVDVVEQEAERARWLESGERDLITSLGGSLVA